MATEAQILAKRRNAPKPTGSRTPPMEKPTMNPCSARNYKLLPCKVLNDGLSFLRKQESRLIDGRGFRIKCGMTGLRVRLTGHDYAKQTQFPKSTNGRKLLCNKVL